MPKIDIRPFKQGVSNEDLLDSIRKLASPDYQRRIPEATKAGVADVLKNLTEYRPGWNEFVEALINRIGLVIVKNNIWTNPFAKFKRGMMGFGDTIEEVMVGLIKAKTYNPNRESLERDIFGNYPAEVQSSFHKINRQDMYPITVNEMLLQRAFLEDGGLGSFVTALLSAPNTSDQWDEFLIISSLFREYYDNGGFFKVQVGDLASLTTDNTVASKNFLKQSRAFASKLQFISTYYNPAGMPVAVAPEDLELFITPEALANIDVDGLAALFNIEKGELAGRINVIPAENLNIPGAQAILTTKDFLVIADTLIQTTSQYNPVSLSTNTFLHHQGIYSASRFVPAILFTTEESDVITIEDTPVTGFTAFTVVDEDGDTVTDVIRGEQYQVLVEAVTTPAGGDNTDVRLELTGALSSRTRINQLGVLKVGLDEDATSLTVTAFALDTDDPELSTSISVDVVGDKATLWPEPHVNPDTDFDGDFEVTPEAPIDEDDVVTVPDVEGVQYRKIVKEGVTFTDTGDIVTVPAHAASVGDTVIFGAITGTTGITAGTTYYVKTVPSANTMTISATDGGATLALTTNGTSVSAQFDVEPGSLHDIVGLTDFTAVATTGYELASGATALWTFDA